MDEPKMTLVMTQRIILLGFLFFAGLGVGIGQGGGDVYAPEQLILQFGDVATQGGIDQVVQDLNAEVIGITPISQAYLLKLPPGADVSGISTAGSTGGTANNPVVDDVGLNYLVGLDPGVGTITQSNIDPLEYHPLPTCNIYPYNINSSFGNNKVKVAIIDTGLDLDSHKNIFEKVVSIQEGYYHDIGSLNNDLTPLTDFIDENGHGTSVAGIISSIFVNGLADNYLDLRIYKAIGENGYGTIFDIIFLIEKAILDGAQIINLSFGYLGNPKLIDKHIIADVIEASIEYNVLFISSAGNLGLDINEIPYYPATLSENITNFLTVGSSDCNGDLAHFSNFGNKKVGMIAPGTEILAPNLNGSWILGSGTSFSTPLVTAIAASYSTQVGVWNANDIFCRVISSVDPSSSNIEEEVKYGFLNIDYDPGINCNTQWGKKNNSKDDILLVEEHFYNGIDLTVKLNKEYAGKSKVVVFDTLGRILFQSEIESSHGIIQVPVSRLKTQFQASILFVSVVTPQGVHAEAILIGS